ncbi:hypothetical protein [Actinoplanes auranticolor]|uniref:Uncharacterized protein n=1 Tax=Actinoplanes auranticolor TaxID=47988 RepID=A0A919SMN2_9ACTN|nr:hypothetical protein [Actinoplanes auranticolor]GIM74870.1 hypothetical protein Aau02nite_63060 [Actinoplanes auranticolor]
MSEHTPQHHHSKDHPAPDDAKQLDLITGEPPVPITVWRTARSSDDTGSSVGARLATRLIAAYSRLGEAVVDLTPDHALTAACTTGGRRHHPAWFTDAASLIIGPATPTTPPPGIGRGDADLEEDVPELATWFGDDLTDPGLSIGTSVTDPRLDSSVQQATSLVVACWPLDWHNDAANRVRLAWLLTACARLLRADGCLILVVTVPANTTMPQDFSPVVQAAAGVGLGYLQHIVAVAADVDGDAFIYHVTDEELLSLAGGDGQRWSVAHLRVHADLMVFSQLDKPRPTGRRGGGQRG